MLTGFFFKLSSQQILWGVIGTKSFGILGAITLFPLKVCFGHWYYKQQYSIPEIFWIKCCYQVTSHMTPLWPKFLLQKYVIWKCDTLQLYCVNYTKLRNYVLFEFSNFIFVMSQLMMSQIGLFAHAQYWSKRWIIWNNNLKYKSKTATLQHSMHISKNSLDKFVAGVSNFFPSVNWTKPTSSLYC